MCLCSIFAVTTPCSAVVEETDKKSSFLSVDGMWQQFLSLEKFVIVHLVMSGSAEEIGLNQEVLQDYLRLRFKNSFAGMKFKPIEDLGEELMKTPSFEEAKKSGTLLLDVITVGQDSTVAYHIHLRGGNIVNRNLYSNQVLGYDSKKNIPSIVRNTISELVDDFAISLFKMKEEL